MKAKEASILLLVSSFLVLIPSSTAIDDGWNYGNYLYSLEILSFDDPVTAGDLGSVTVEIGANTEVVLNVEFKGVFTWGDWTFSSTEVFLGSGLESVNVNIEVPYKAIIEPASSFYYYVYATLQEDDWNPSSWSLVQEVTVSPLSDVSHEELVAYMSHLKWLVDTSSLSSGTRKSLMSKLEAAGKGIDSAYVSGNLNKLQGALGALNSFITILEVNSKVAEYPDSGLWKNQAQYIIERITIAIS